MGGESTHLPDLDPKPILRLHFNDIGHPATAEFLALIDCSRLLDNAIKNVLRHLYLPCERPILPRIRSVTLVLRAVGGVAYTTGIPLDDDHKEIHFNLDYIKRLINDPIRCRDEIIGVVTHEMVHCYQYNCLGTAPGGLIEGIADFVRLRSNLSPPHWKRPGSKSAVTNPPEPRATQAPGVESPQKDMSEDPVKVEADGDKWDDGYQKTAYFLDWLDKNYGHGIIARMNETMRTTKYEENEFWTSLFGEEQNIDVLWKKYQKSLMED